MDCSAVTWHERKAGINGIRIVLAASIIGRFILEIGIGIMLAIMLSTLDVCADVHSGEDASTTQNRG